MHTTPAIINALVADGLSRDELAARLGVARETVSRWSTGTNAPSFEALQGAAAAAGYQLDLRLLPAEPKLVALVHDQLDLGPADRLKALLGPRWACCRDALWAAATVGELGVLIGPVAAALRGAPQRPGDGRVDLLIAADDREEVSDRLLEHGAWPDGIERSAHAAGSERRERWQADSGVLSVRERAAGVGAINTIRDRALPVMLNRDAAGLVRVALVEDLATIASSSPWTEDAVYLPGLRAVLASGRYSTRHPPDESLQLA
jgi:transcriptional regulator with XRE-family HTH domain